MENERRSNTGTAVVITVLVMLVLGMGCFIGYDKFINKDNKSYEIEHNTPEENNTTIQKEDCPEIKKGECPLTKFDSSYVLTDSDKEEILDAIDAFGSGFSRSGIDVATLNVSKISDSSYFINVVFNDSNNMNKYFASIAKVNGAFKVLIAGSGDTAEGRSTMKYTLERICS